MSKITFIIDDHAPDTVESVIEALTDSTLCPIDLGMKNHCSTRRGSCYHCWKQTIEEEIENEM